MGGNLNSKDNNNNSVQISEIYRGFGENLEKCINFREDINKVPVQSLTFYKEAAEVFEKHGKVVPPFIHKAQEHHDYFMQQHHKLNSEGKAYFNDVRANLKEDVLVLYNRNPDISSEEAERKFLSRHFSTYQRIRLL